MAETDASFHHTTEMNGHFTTSMTLRPGPDGLTLVGNGASDSTWGQNIRSVRLSAAVPQPNLPFAPHRTPPSPQTLPPPGPHLALPRMSSFRLGRTHPPCPPPTSCSSVAHGRAPRPSPPLAMTRAGVREAAFESGLQRSRHPTRHHLRPLCPSCPRALPNRRYQIGQLFRALVLVFSFSVCLLSV